MERWFKNTLKPQEAYGIGQTTKINNGFKNTFLNSPDNPIVGRMGPFVRPLSTKKTLVRSTKPFREKRIKRHACFHVQERSRNTWKQDSNNKTQFLSVCDIAEALV